MYRATTSARTLALLGALLSLSAAAPEPARGGCGCDKPPPPPAQVRPGIAYAGTPVTLFSPAFVVGDAYTVTFTSGTTGQTMSVSGTIVSRRDVADGQYKPQLVVPLPSMPLGPVSISATRGNRNKPDVAIDDSAFTVVPAPVALPSQYGAWHYPNFQAAVGRDGVVYIALDATAIHLPMVFEARAAGYPLRFGAEDVVFRNIQGFLMQLLMGGAPGATPPFDLVLSTYSLFYQGLVGNASVSVGHSSQTDSYDPITGKSSAHGDVFTNGPLTLSGSAAIKGDATAASFSFSGSSRITGQQTLLAAPTSFMQIQVPAGLPDLGAITLNQNHVTMTINGPGSFRVSALSMTGKSKLYIDNAGGPVTLYVTGGVSVAGTAKVYIADPDPEHFAIYVAGTGPVDLENGTPGLYGVVYAPTSSVLIGGSAQFSGAFVGQDVSLDGSATVHYDQALRGQ